MRGRMPRWATSGTERLTLPLTMDVALSRAEAALAKLPLARPVARDVDGRGASATVRGNWMTYGNSVNVSIRPGGVGVDVVVSSRPVTPQLFDWRRSRRLAKAVATTLAGSSADAD